MHYISIWMSRPSMLEIMKKQIQLQAQPPPGEGPPTQPNARARVRGSAQLPQPRERIMRNQMCSQLGRDIEGARPQVPPLTRPQVMLKGEEVGERPLPQSPLLQGPQSPLLQGPRKPQRPLPQAPRKLRSQVSGEEGLPPREGVLGEGLLPQALLHHHPDVASNFISDTNVEIDRKIKESVRPTHDDKKRLQNRIKQLDKKQQLHLFHTIIKPLDIYTVTDNGTFFDLNELVPKDFWRLSYHVNLTYDCIQRDRVRSELEKTESSTFRQSIYNREYDIDSEIDNTHQYERERSHPDERSTDEFVENREFVENSESVENRGVLQMVPPKYSQLRENALRSCVHKKSESSIKSNEYESKVLERNVYTDKKKKVVNN